MLTRSQCFIAVFCCLFVAAGTAWADDQQSQDDDAMQRAQEAFDRGARHYYNDEYADAIVEFRRANQLYEHPIFHYNIARSHLALDRPERAMSAAMAAQERAEEMPEDAAATNSGIIAGYQTVLNIEEMVDELADEMVADVTDPDPEPVSRWGGIGWTGTATATAGLAALGAAAFMDRQVSSGINELRDESNFDNEEHFYQRRNEVAGQQTVGRAFLWSGAALTAIGGSLAVWELATVSGQNGTDVALVPTLGVPGINATMQW